MCIICSKPVGKPVSSTEIDTMWKNNPHGGGYMFVDDDENIVIRKFMDITGFKRSFFKDEDKHGDTSPFVMHFRIATDGAIDETNVHPFRVNKDVAFCHNGILSSCRTTGKDRRSDTRLFRDEILSKLPNNFLRNRGTKLLIEDFIGSYNKLAFLDNKKEVHIYNAQSGVWDNGRWFSNDTFEDHKSKFYYGGFPYSYGEDDWVETMPNSKPKQSHCFMCWKNKSNMSVIFDGICIDCKNIIDKTTEVNHGDVFSIDFSGQDELLLLGMPH